MSQSSKASSYSNTNINNESPISNTIQNRELSNYEIDDILSFNIIINTILCNYKPEDNNFLYYCFDLIDLVRAELVRANIQKM